MAAPYRPRVAPETRRLLIAAGVALAVLWGLARLRFPNTPVAASPVPPLLAQLAPPPTFDELAAEVTRLRGQVASAVVALPAGDGHARAALRVRFGIAAAILPVGNATLAAPTTDQVAARDPATGLTLVHVAAGDESDPLPEWTPQNIDAARFLLMTQASAEGQIAFVPVFVSGLRAEPSRAWHDRVWRLPAGAAIPPDAFVFTTRGELVGVAVDEGAGLSIVPASVLRTAAAALLDAPRPAGGWLGIEVAPLTPALARATGVEDGVIVSWIDTHGPGAGTIAAGDVIEAVESDAVATPAQWRAAIARIAPGSAVRLRVRSAHGDGDVTLVAAAPPAPSPLAFGVHLRRTPGAGSTITAVDDGSTGARAGLRTGDVITRAGSSLAPGPADVRRAYRDATTARPLLIAVTRGGEHLVIAVAPAGEAR